MRITPNYFKTPFLHDNIWMEEDYQEQQLWSFKFWRIELSLFFFCFYRSLIESGPRISFAVVVKVKCFVPFAQLLEYFTMYWFETSLDMFVELSQITSYNFEASNDLRQVETYFKMYQIASICITIF